MSAAAACTAHPDGGDPGDGVAVVQTTSGNQASTAPTGLNMLGTADARVCDDDGICEVAAPRTS